MPDFRVALVSRELYPLPSSSGIGQFVSSAARLLSEIAEVTVLTSSTNEPAYRRLRRARDARLPPRGVRVAFVEEPTEEETGSYFSVLHRYSARVYERLRELYPEGAPELIEFGDFHGEGCVTAQAAATLDPFLRRSLLCVRIHTTDEIGSILNGCLPREPEARLTFAIERLALREADRLIWEGGDVSGAYLRFYGAERLAPTTRIRYPYHGPSAKPGSDRDYSPGEPLCLLYAGRLERRKGVHNLLEAAAGLDRDDFVLTMVGADTATAPLGVSMRDHLLAAAADDGRIQIRHPVGRAELAEVVRAHDIVVLPSLWECWPYAALEALHLNRPILATPVGGLAEMTASGEGGWRTAGSDPDSLAAALETVLDRRDELRSIVRAERPAALARRLADPEEIKQAYSALAARRAPRAAARRPDATPLVSAIVPYHASAPFVKETIESLLDQTHPRLEVVLVNDGSFEDDDWIVAELAARFPIEVVTQANSGLGAARNAGVAASRGRYVFPLDADDLARPSFVARCVEVLERRPELSYVSSWSRYVEESGHPVEWQVTGWQPLGIGYSEAANRIRNIGGSASAVIRRRVFDLGFRYSEELTSYEDWHLYRDLEEAGHLGAVIPERLLAYRIHRGSMTRQMALDNHAQLEAEIEARIRENSVRWTSSNA